MIVRMKRLLAVFPAFALVVTAQPSAVVLTHVTLIDAAGSPPAANRTVVIDRGRIQSIGQTGKTRIPKDSVIVDGAGKFLIPGLWDMHVHLRGGPALIADNEASLSLYVANGIVGVREMAVIFRSRCFSGGAR